MISNTKSIKSGSMTPEKRILFIPARVPITSGYLHSSAMLLTMRPYSILLSSLGFAMMAAGTNIRGRGQWNSTTLTFLLILRFPIDVSAGVLANFTLFSEYSAAATCEANFESQRKPRAVVCSPGVCPTLAQTDTTIITGFKKYGTSQAAAGR